MIVLPNFNIALHKKINNSFSLLAFFLIVFIPAKPLAQTFTGTVKDSLNQPLQSANVIAEPIEDGKELKFSVTDYLGRYKLDLNKSSTYIITASYLGYETQTIKKPKGNTSKKRHDFILKQVEEKLDEIVIIHKYKPITVKKDTLIYNINAFKNGDEYKMIDVLEKLPGVEVDENGIIKVQGKKVTKLLVENKPFFGGSTKLAIENIPADALEKIEVIDKFNEISFLKKVSDSKQLAINVKLKKEKKKFIFGDIEGATEVANDNGYYLLHSALFYYNKKANLNFITNLNNIGKRSFSYEDLMRFQHTNSKFIKRKEASPLFNFARNNENALENDTKFTALNFNFTINPQLIIDTYGVFSRSLQSSYRESEIKYLQKKIFYTESKTHNKNVNDLLTFGNLKVNYSPNKNSKSLYNFQIQLNRPKTKEADYSLLNNKLNVFNTEKNADVHKIKQFFEWHKKYNLKHIVTTVFNHNYEKNKLENSWGTDSPLLNEYITYQVGNVYNVSQVKKSKKNSIDFLFKYYWLVDNLHHLYFTIGDNLDFTNLQISEHQTLSDENTVKFANDKFGNNIQHFINDLSIGLEYKFKIQKWENKFSLYTHYYNIITKQSNKNTTNVVFFEPKWNSEYEFNPSENIEFEYSLSNEFPEANQLIERFTIQDYNTIFKGNNLLKNEKFHNAKLNYSKHDTYKGLFIFFDAVYNRKTRVIRNNINLKGINKLITPTLSYNPNTNIRFSGMLEKQIYKFRLLFRPTLRWLNYEQNINNEAVLNQRNSQHIALKLRTADKKWPKLSVSYKKSFKQFSGLTNSSLSSNNIKFSSSINFLSYFNFKTDYKLSYVTNQNNQENVYQIINASIRLKKRNSPLSFELFARNILNNKVIIQNSFSDFTILDSKTYTLPRMVMFSLKYKI